MAAKKRLLAGVLATAMLGTSACGYLIYPERTGLRTDRVDATVVVLDAIGLLFYVIPGVVAFAVDYATGCIYLPDEAKGPFSLNGESGAPQAWVPVTHVAPYADDAEIAAALKRHFERTHGGYTRKGLPESAKSAEIRWLDHAALPQPAVASAPVISLQHAGG